jgi:photosynthetic reaction center cytochrome c subunit
MNRNPGLKSVAVIAAILAGAMGMLFARPVAQQNVRAAKPKPAEEAYKNITTLKGIPAEQLIPTMQFISSSLGVECDFCHVQHAFDKDEKKPKLIARKMMVMMAAINKDNFEGHRQVTCNTCHRGSPHPAAIPAIAEEDSKPVEASSEEQPAPPNVTSDEVIEAYVKALGGKAAIDKISSRVMKGKMLGPGGRQMPIEILAKAPDKRMSLVHTPNGDSITAFDGHSGWLGAPGRPPREMAGPENDAARLDADLHFATDIPKIFQQIRVGRPEKIEDKEMVVLMAMREGQPPVKLYFDKQSGLLVRMVRYTETALGRNPTQIDYADYRDAGGAKTPYRWTIARPGGRFTIQVDEAQSNVPIDDQKFVKPEAPAQPENKAPSR